MMWIISMVIATGICDQMMAYLLLVSSKAAGMMLKFAAMGVTSVPQ